MLEKKKKTMLNNISTKQPTKTVEVETKSADASNPSLYVTYDGVTETENWSDTYYGNRVKIIGNIILRYNATVMYGVQYGWHIWAYGDVTFNGTTYHAGEHIVSWSRADTVDYTFNGTVIDEPNSTQAFVGFGNNSTTWLIVIDNGVGTFRPYNDYLNKTIVYDLVDVTYNTTDRWKFTANDNLIFNRVQYQSGEIVDRIALYGDYDMRIFKSI